MRIIIDDVRHFALREALIDVGYFGDVEANPNPLEDIHLGNAVYVSWAEHAAIGKPLRIHLPIDFVLIDGPLVPKDA